MRLPGGSPPQPAEVERRSLNSELWHACAGPLVSLPAVGSRVVYFPQGHSEQVAASTNREIDAHIPNYPNLPPQLICHLHNVTMHADVETDEVYAQMTLQPLNPQEQKESSCFVPDLGTPSKQPLNYFCKTLTASDTSTHGGFSIPRRAAEKVFPLLDFTQQPPAQEIISRDLHDTEWKFRHIYRGQPKRHLLTTGWSVFVSAKRLVAGDSVLFIRNDSGQLLLGIRRANKSPTVMPSSVLSSDSMHIGVLAAAAHAAATNSPFNIFYNPRASPSEFVIPLAKYEKAAYHTRVSVGMRFRMLFETEESSIRRYMGTVTGIGDLDPIRWPGSQWRSLKVGWDESTAGERQPRVSLWEIEPLTTFLMYPPPYSLNLKRPWVQQIQGFTSFPGMKDGDSPFKKPWLWMGGENGDRVFQGLNSQGGVDPWMHMQQKYDPLTGANPDIYQTVAAGSLLDARTIGQPKNVLQFQTQSSFPAQQLHGLVPQPPLPRQVFQQQQQAQQPVVQQQLQSLQQQQPSSQSRQQQALNAYLQQPHQKVPNPQGIQQQQPQLPNNILQNQLQQSSQTKVLQQLQQSVTNPQIISQQLNCQQPANKMPQVASGLLSTSSVPLTQSSTSLSNTMLTQLPLPTQNTSLAPSVASSASSPLQAILHSLASSDNVPCQNLGRISQSPVQQQQKSMASVPCQEGQTSSGSWYMASDMSNNQFMSSPNAQIDVPIPSASQCIVSQTQSIDESGGMSQQTAIISQANPPTRTFTKVYKLGSIGRSLDVTRFTGYPELRCELARMFNLEGQLEDPRSGWQLVFVDKEHDVLLLGDDPWDEFVSTVHCIKILSPPEVMQMTQEGMELLNSMPMHRQTSSSSEECVTRQDSRNIYDAITSGQSFDY